MNIEITIHFALILEPNTVQIGIGLDIQSML